MSSSLHGACRPAFRPLRVYTFDPSFANSFDDRAINEISLDVRWEVDPATNEDLLRPGPVGEYIEVVDYDPASGLFYPPVDLDDPHLLAQDGLAPSVGNPMFHQQMVYAVAMSTIERFEQALGRAALWAPRVTRDAKGKFLNDEFVRQLRIYPHALRDSNAYYSHRKLALLFGYFEAPGAGSGHVAGNVIFTCLSHDVIAHETAHALLDGVHRRFKEPTNPDSLALHEAFADIVALFLHFSHSKVLKHQLARTRGDLSAESLMSKLAWQLGQATGRRGALRDALGSVDKDGAWRPEEPDAKTLARTRQAHARGSILVAAVFEAFLMIYRERTADLMRIATGGTGVPPAGALHPDLVARLAKEASKAAGHVLEICIRALDYVPPVDVTFGDYLRALITADFDLQPEDRRGYRVAFIDACRKRGIHPHGMRSLCQESMLWPSCEEIQMDLRPSELPECVSETLQVAQEAVEPELELGRAVERSCRVRTREERKAAVQALFSPKLDDRWHDMARRHWARVATRRKKKKERLSLPTRRRGLRPPLLPPPDGPPPKPNHQSGITNPWFLQWDLEHDRKAIWLRQEFNAGILHAWLVHGPGACFLEPLGLRVDEDPPPSVYRSGTHPSVEVHAVRPALRRTPLGNLKSELVVEITQRRRGWLNPAKQHRIDTGLEKIPDGDRGDFRFRRGCSVLIDPTTMEIRRVIRTRGDILDDTELDRMRLFLLGDQSSPTDAYHSEFLAGDHEIVARLHACNPSVQP